MKKFFILVCLALIGCADSEENASTNLRKGDEFMAKGEYEIAEYYYDKIPEESVLYKTVLRRKQDIEKLSIAQSNSDVAPDSEENIVITNHKFLIRLGKMPVHTLSIRNKSTKQVNTIELQFIYIDDTGTEIARLNTMVNAYLNGGDEKEFDNIAPGMINGKALRVKVNIIRAMFF